MNWWHLCMLLDIKRLHISGIFSRLHELIWYPCVHLGHDSCSIAVCNGASEGSRSVQRRRLRWHLIVGRAELFRRSVRAITLLLARNNAAAAVTLAYVALINILIVLWSIYFYRIIVIITFYSKIVRYFMRWNCDRLAEIWEREAIFEMNFKRSNYTL